MTGSHEINLTESKCEGHFMVLIEISMHVLTYSVTTGIRGQLGDCSIQLYLVTILQMLYS